MAPRDGRSSELKGTARERLLDAALDEVRARGYDGASLQSIARRAGLTKGAIYWSFRDKHDLFRALVESRLDGPARALMRITETAPHEGTTGDLVSKGVAQLVRERPELVLLAHEQWALAVRDPGTKPAYLARQSSLREALATALRARHETTGIPLTYPAEQLATAVLALANGLAAEALVDPEAVPDELLGDMLALLYDGLAARAEGLAAPTPAGRARPLQ
jgi:AcrR family transcriptional regulator